MNHSTAVEIAVLLYNEPLAKSPNSSIRDGHLVSVERNAMVIC